MTRKQVGIWMYENSGGSQIQQKMVDQLREREIESVCGLNLAQASAKDGTVFCQGKDLSELELFFSYNAGEQTPYQVYLYQTIDSMMPMINNYTSFALTEDKFRTAHKLKQAGVNTTDYVVCNRDNVDQIRDQLIAWGGQAICKPVDGWGGNGIIKLEQARDIDLLAPFLKTHPSHQFYLERVIQNDFSDYRVDIVDGKFVACYGRKAAAGSWKTNISSGGHVILREPLPEVVGLAQQAAFVTGLEVAGVDIIYDIEKQRYVVIEVNGIPAFATPDQEAFGLNFNDTKINYIVDLIERNVNPTQSQSIAATLDTSFIHLNANHSNTQQVEISL
ncbi:ATP-grasp domain-containing protein [Vibrio sp. YIC-376]|uniref:ATP-grasp domain-containing protein n=1 Tax=Vibrio sp. YIC-376 TaxID=3136162 RepID=UPI00402AF538